MSNIKTNPSFTPTPGTPTAAPRGFPYAHDNLAEVARKAVEAMRDAVEPPAMIPPTAGLIAPDLTKQQKIADGLREMAASQRDPLVASMMEIAADVIENDLDLIATLHRELKELVDACTPEGGA